MARPGTARALEILHEVSAETGIDVASLRHTSALKHFAMARRKFCVRAIAEKLPCKTVAAVICRDYTTVLYHASEEMQRRKREVHQRRRAAAHA